MTYMQRKMSKGFMVGVTISFLASLPPGLTNVVTLQLAMNEKYATAIWFALGLAIAEVFYARICAALMNQMVKWNFLRKYLQWVVILILVAMATFSFLQSGHATILPAGDGAPAFLSGFVLMILNPVQIPFWLGWATILLEKKVLSSGKLGEAGYLAGVGLGSVAASTLFIAGGQMLISTLEINNQVMHFIFGCIFGVMSLIYLVRILKASLKFGV